MSLTDYEETRITLIEYTLNDLQKAVSNLASKLQLRQLSLLKQTEVDTLIKRVDELERLMIILQKSLS
jgi:hypothetical protein